MLPHISPHSIEPQCCFYLGYCLSEKVFSVVLFSADDIEMFVDDFIRISWCESHAHTVVWECCKDDQQSQWEMLKFHPQLPLNPSSDRHQIWRAWLVVDIFHQEKIGLNQLRGFFSPYTRNIHPHVRYATLPYTSTHVYYFFGSSNRLQSRRLRGF